MNCPSGVNCTVSVRELQAFGLRYGSIFKSLPQRKASLFNSRLRSRQFTIAIAINSRKQRFQFTLKIPHIRRLRVANHSQYSSSELLSILIIPLSLTICKYFDRNFQKKFFHRLLQRQTSSCLYELDKNFRCHGSVLVRTVVVKIKPVMRRNGVELVVGKPYPL